MVGISLGTLHLSQQDRHLISAHWEDYAQDLHQIRLA
jgi:hypothetical protein